MTTPILVLDAGHGLNTAGKRTMNGSRGIIHEWELNDAVVRKITSILSNYNVKIYRTDDPTGKADVSLASRVSKTNSINPDLFISIHHNSTPGATGVEVYYHTYGTEADKQVASLIAPKLSEQTGLRNRGVKNAEFYVLRCKATAVLVEGGFMDTTADYEVITSDKGKQAYAEAVAEAVIAYLGLTKVKEEDQNIDLKTRNEKLTLLAVGKEESQSIYSHPDVTSQIVNQFKKGEMKAILELSKDEHWGRIGANQWIGIDYVHLYLAPFLYNPKEHKQKIYSHPDATSTVVGTLTTNKFIPILEISTNAWGRTAKGWISLAYGGLIETSFLVKCKDNDVNAYSHPDATSKVVTVLKQGVAVTVVDLSADGNWGLCKSGYWIPLDFVAIL